jgi:hypothetical protein
VNDLLDLYGSWKAVAEDVLDPRTPEGWDLDALYADYLAGTTQKEIAERLGVDAEQVRQVFMRAGLPKRTRQEVNALFTTVRIGRMVEEVRDKVVSAYAETGTLTETVTVTGVSNRFARRILSEAGVPQTQPWRRACPDPRVISERDATRILREASKVLGGTMAAREYRDLALTRVMPNGQPWPRTQETLVTALGVRTWNEALRKAGVPVRLSTAGRLPVPVEPGLQIIRTLTKRLGRSPTMQDYDKVATSDGLILSTALARRHGRRWGNVLDAARSR